MMLIQAIPEDIYTWFVTYILDNVFTYILGLTTSILYLFIRPKTSFWLAKQRMRISNRNMVVNLDSIMSFGIHEQESDDLLEEIGTLIKNDPRIMCDLHTSNQGEILQTTVSLPEQRIRFDAILSLDEETDEIYGLKFKSENDVTYSTIEKYIEGLFTIRDLLYEALSQSSILSAGLPRITFGLKWRGGQIRLLQWLNYEHELDGFITIPELDLQIQYGPGYAQVSAISFQPYMKEILRNLVVESVYQ